MFGDVHWYCPEWVTEERACDYLKKIRAWELENHFRRNDSWGAVSCDC